MSEQRKCKQCSADFETTDQDLEFLDKISPEFAGKKYPIPAPSFCPQCRQIRRLTWRNERSLYKRKCDATGEDIVTVYSPDKPYTVFKNSYWRSDAWDPMDFGLEYDGNKSFFEQFHQLYEKIPKQANNSTIAENCDFCNFVWHTNNCYLCFNVGYSEDCLFCTEIINCKSCMDCFSIKDSNYCYKCFDCINCTNSKYLDKCSNTSESFFAYDCHGCNNVFMSSNLKNKNFVFRGEQLSKEEYQGKISEIKLGSRGVLKELSSEFDQLKQNSIHKENSNFKVEDCTGDYLKECANCYNSFNLYKAKDSKNITNANSDVNNSLDVDNCAELEMGYEGASITGYKTGFGIFIIYCNDNYYNIFCENCTNCFGCIGLNHKQYCILNKQYTKEEYEDLVPKIIEKMTSDGEWGEFFSAQLCPFGYNETYAQIMYPKSSQEAKEIGYNWQDNDFSMKFDGEFYLPDDDIGSYKSEESKRNQLLSGVLKCESSGKPFRIIPQELAFYIAHNIPIPTKYPEARYLEIFSRRNPRKLYHRKCMNEGCEVEFETTYAQDRPEKVYCESCYQKTII